MSSFGSAVCLEATDLEVEPKNAIALPELFRASADGLYRFILVRVGNDRHAADDLLQQTCHVAVRRRQAIPTNGAAEAWLFGIARNLVRRHWRSRRWWRLGRADHEADTARRLLQAMDAGPLPEELLTAQETSRALLLAVTELPTDDQQLVFSYYFDGRSQVDLAAESGVTPKAVEMRLYRIRSRLRTILEGQEGKD